MYFRTVALALALSMLQFALLVEAGIYVLKPAANSTCHAGRTCTIEWVDDGTSPLLAAAGICTFGLYTGNMQLVQAIPPVDVSATRSISFTPNAAAGPNSNSYYIAIISTTAKENSSDSSSISYASFSPFFTIDEMTGSFNSPLPAATSTFPIPSSLTRSSNGSETTSTTILSTITIGTLSTSPPPLPTLTVTSPTTTSVTSQTKLTTSKLPSSTTTPTPTSNAVAVASSGSPAPTTSSNEALRRMLPTSALTTTLLILLSLLL